MTIYYMPKLSAILGIPDMPIEIDDSYKLNQTIIGTPHTEEHKTYMSALLKNRVFSESTKRKMSESHTGKVLSLEHKQAISKWHKDNSHRMQGLNNPVHTHGHPRLGVELTKDTKSKISSTLKNKPLVTCPHCNKSGAASIMKRWHFDNCKVKSELS